MGCYTYKGIKYSEQELRQLLKDEGSKSRRILEIQSDLFQKGRDKDSLVPNPFAPSNVDRHSDKSELPEFDKELETDLTNQNAFLQLLNKDNNWVTFFVKSIIQDSAKKGYEKVLFPSGNTASKVEGHTTLEEFKKQKENRISQLDKQIDKLREADEEIISDIVWAEVDVNTPPKTKVDIDEEIKKRNNEVNQLKQELERVETEGFAALRPIYKFYEETVFNILKKAGYNPILITDEYDNTWFEVDLTKTKSFDIQLKKSKKTVTEEEKKELSESPFQAQYVFFKRRLAELAKRQQGLKEGTPAFNIIQEEIDTINEKFIKANEEQSQELYKELGEQTLAKIDEHITTLTKGERLTDRNIEFVADVLDTFKDFQGLKDRVGELETQLEPVIQEFTLRQIQTHSTEKEAITQEKIDSQTEDIGKFTLGVGALSDLANYIGRTIGSIIKAAQNKVSTRNKQITKVVQEEVDLLNTWAKKNGVTLERSYNIFIQPKKGSTGLTMQYYESGNENPNWTRIQNTSELKRFYDFYQNTIQTAQENLPLKLGKGFIPNIKKSTISNKLKSLVPVHKTEKEGFVGNEDLFADVLPTEYTKRISDAEKSRDLGASLLQFAAYATNYEEMSDILPTVRILQRGLTKRLNSKGQVIQREFTKSSEPSKKIIGEQSNIYKMVEAYINMQVFGEMKFSEGKIKIGNLYDEEGKPIGEKYILGSDIADAALKYNSLLRIGFSPITAGANWLFGDIANIIEAVGGRFFTNSGLIQASNIFMKQNFNKDSVLNKLLEKLNPLQELEDYDFINRVSLKSKMSTEKFQEYAYSMQKSGEKWLQSRTMLAVMIKEGYLTSSGDLTEKYTKAGEQEKQQLTDKVQRLNQLIHGRYSARESATLGQSIIYRLLIQFKKWVPSALEARFMQKQYDNRLQVDIEGRYRTFAKLIINLGDTIERFKKGQLTELEVYNSKKMVIELTLMAATILGMMALGGDDDESKKLRKHWAVKTGMTLLNRVSGDIAFFYSPAQIAHTAKNAVPLIRTFDDLRLAISYIPVAFDAKEGIYKTGSRKGQSKLLTKLGNVTIGIKPILDIKRLMNQYELEELK